MAHRPALRAGAALTVTFRQLIGVGIVCCGASAMLFNASRWFVQLDARVASALAVGGAAALATAIGALPLMLWRRIPQWAADTLQAFGSGVVLSAIAFSMVLPALAHARTGGAGDWEAGGLVGCGMLLGGLYLWGVQRWVPPEFFLRQGDADVSLQTSTLARAGWLWLAVSLCNLPEGLAIGAAYGGRPASAAHVLAIGISVLDLSEGLVIAVALRGVGHGRTLSVLLAAASGLIEPLMAMLGATAIVASPELLSRALAFSAGAALVAVCHVAIPQAYAHGKRNLMAMGLMVGFVLMMWLAMAIV